MSASSRTPSDKDSSKVELPVFITPVELLFSEKQRKTFLTIFNPYDNDAHFTIMTTSPNRFDVSISKGIIKPQRRIDITIRLLNNALNELPPSDEPTVVDYFRVSLQVGKVKGIKPVKVQWGTNLAASSKTDEKEPLMTRSRSKAKLNLNQTTSQSCLQNLRSQPQHSIQNLSLPDEISHNSSANLVCTICAMSCVIILFLPISLNFCDKVKNASENESSSTSDITSFITNFLGVSYEMKLGCSFALGLFTYRLITTLPN